MIRHTLTVLACAGVIALVACSSDPGDQYPDVGSFCSAYADALCQGVAGGCGTTVDTCKGKAQAKCSADSAATGRSYRPSAAPDCVDKTKSVYGAKTFTAAQETEQQSTCGRVFSGNAAKNAPCQIDFDCSGSMVCDKGVCADKSDKKLGEACNNPGDICESSSYCGNQGALKFCIAKKGLNDLCPAGVPCTDDLFCNAGVCAAKVAPGQPCSADAECTGATTSPYCDPFQKKCLPKYGLSTDSCKQLGGT